MTPLGPHTLPIPNTDIRPPITYTTTRALHIARIDRTSRIGFERGGIDTSLVHAYHQIATFGTILHHSVIHGEFRIKGTTHYFALDFFAINRLSVRGICTLRDSRLG